MFNMDDFNNDNSLRIPSGFSNDIEFVYIMQSVANVLCKTDHSDPKDRERLSMSLINIACGDGEDVVADRAVSIILSLVHHLSTIIEATEVDLEEYHKAYNDETLSDLYDNPNIPYYEDDNDWWK